MPYEPRDLQQLTDTVIALDIAFRAVCEYIGKSNPTLANEIISALKLVSVYVYDSFPYEQAANITGIVDNWETVLHGTSEPIP